MFISPTRREVSLPLDRSSRLGSTFEKVDETLDWCSADSKLTRSTPRLSFLSEVLCSKRRILRGVQTRRKFSTIRERIIGFDSTLHTYTRAWRMHRTIKTTKTKSKICFSKIHFVVGWSCSYRKSLVCNKSNIKITRTRIARPYEFANYLMLWK